MSVESRLAKIVGKNRVSGDPGELDAFSLDHSYVGKKAPALIVRPENPDEVQDIVKLANEMDLSLVPVSSGAPRFRGDSVPSVDGAVIVDLSQMNKIMWINRRNRVALVEPGVTFGELQAELDKHGLRAMFPLAPKSSKSVIGAYMEREPFTVPRYAWDLGDPVAGAEFVLGDGNTMRTGGAAGPAATLEAQRATGGAQKLPMSPISMDFRRIAQGSSGSFGVCNWISLRCELLPEHEQVFFGEADSPAPLMEAARRFLNLRLADDLYVVNRLTFASLLKTEADKIEALKEKLPPYVLVASVAGFGDLAKDQFNYKAADLKDEAKKLELPLSSRIGGVTGAAYLSQVVRKCSAEPYWKLRAQGDCRELFFLAPPNKAAGYVEQALALAQKGGFNPDDVGVYLQMAVHGAVCHCGLDYFVSPEKAEALKPLFMETSKALFENGAYFSRPYGPWSGLVYPRYETFVKYANKLKAVFDPKGVMNPGKLCFKEN
ncbi:FAD-binding oxidoreductase [Desulfatibacillum aliphaticivorans]|uniref:FAD-binding oxidoreductase n=1 Tax=Desulfatibacillum aliphaticivorans TaxID=218208 RepID=UPI0003F4FAD0|nr:FAD-binding oxidoreductase [Desulfatibacillum aliphaticivorans]